MKIINLVGCAVVSIIIITQLLCGIKKEKEPRATKPLKFIFISTCAREDFFIPVKKGMDQAASLLGVECSFVGTKEVDLIQQAAMVEEAVRQGIDGIALNIIDTLAFDTVVKVAIDKGIPVVAFNVDDNKTPNARLSGVCQNFYKAGFDLGKRISAHILEKSTVLFTMHSSGISALNDRIKGEQDALRERKINAVTLITGTNPDTAKMLIANVLKVNTKIKTVLCTGLADTQGAGLAIEESFSSNGYLAAGFDLSPEILRLITKGYVLCTVDQQPFMQGFYPVIQLYQYCRYGILPSDNEIVASFVDRDNVEAVEKLCREHIR
jgi:simple sugar transport system substrate-binding protein